MNVCERIVFDERTGIGIKCQAQATWFYVYDGGYNCRCDRHRRYGTKFIKEYSLSEWKMKNLLK